MRSRVTRDPRQRAEARADRDGHQTSPLQGDDEAASLASAAAQVCSLLCRRCDDRQHRAVGRSAENPRSRDRPHLRRVHRQEPARRTHPRAGRRRHPGIREFDVRRSCRQLDRRRSRCGSELRRHRQGRHARDRRVLALVAACLVGSIPPQHHRPEDHLQPACLGGGEASPSPPSVFRQDAAWRDPQPRHQRHRQHLLDAVVDVDLAPDVGAHRPRRPDDDVRHFSDARPDRTDRGAGIGAPRCQGRQASTGVVQGSVDRDGQDQRADRGELQRSRPGTRVRASGRSRA